MVRPQGEMGSMQVLPEMQDPPNQSITFPFHGVKLPLCQRQCLAGISYNSFRPTFSLWQNRTNPLGRPVYIEAKWLLEIWPHQSWGSHQSLLQIGKRPLAVLIPDKNHILLSELKQRTGQFRIPLNIFTVASCQSQEGSDIGNYCRRQESPHCIDLTRIRSSSLLTTCPRKTTLPAAKQHLLGFNFKFTSLSLESTAPRCWRWSCHSSLWTLRSSTKIFRNESPKPLKTSVIVHVKVLVAFLNPNGMTVHSNNPLLVISAVLPMSSRAILIC